VECNVGVSYGLIFVNFADQAPDFHEFVGRFDPYLEYYGIHQSKVAHRQVYPTAANWKCVAENLGECYHCAPVHPTYSRMQDVDLVPLGFEAMTAREGAGSCDVQSQSFAPISDTPDSPYLQGAGYHEIGKGRRTGAVGGNPVAPLMGEVKDFDGRSGGITFNPLSFIVFYPDYAFFATFVPRSTLQTDIEVVWLVNDKAVSGADYDPQIVSHLWDLTTKEDQTIIGANQKGISSSGYRPGPYSLDEVRVVETLDWYLKHFVDVD
jgi:Rieske 2Fe-2S family protein